MSLSKKQIKVTGATVAGILVIGMLIFMSSEKSDQLVFCYAENGYGTQSHILVPVRSSENYSAIASSSYSTDGSYVFYNCQKIAGADAGSFTLVPPDREIAKDWNHVYYQGEIIPGADPASYKIVDSYWDFGKDKHSVYFETKAIPGFDAGSFQVKDVGLNIAELSDKNRTAYIDSSGNISADPPPEKD